MDMSPVASTTKGSMGAKELLDARNPMPGARVLETHNWEFHVSGVQLNGETQTTHGQLTTRP
jgi:hypothetical protein